MFLTLVKVSLGLLCDRSRFDCCHFCILFSSIFLAAGQDDLTMNVDVLRS